MRKSASPVRREGRMLNRGHPFLPLSGSALYRIVGCGLCALLNALLGVFKYLTYIIPRQGSYFVLIAAVITSVYQSQLW
jgi:hypothetical protein